MNKTNVTTVVTVVEDEKTSESARADRRKAKKTEAEASAIITAAFETKAGEASESGE